MNGFHFRRLKSGFGRILLLYFGLNSFAQDALQAEADAQQC